LRSTLMAVAIGLVIGGALGNVGDRLFRDTGGAVVDFVDFGWWPVFNLADSCVTIGAVLLIVRGLFPPRERDARGAGGPSSSTGPA
jgi:signal peptidase II